MDLLPSKYPRPPRILLLLLDRLRSIWPLRVDRLPSILLSRPRRR